MNCPSCNKEVVADKLFCNWCEVFIPNPRIGKKAGLFRRWFATFIDPIAGIILYMIIAAIFGGCFSISNTSIIAIFIVTIGYGIFFFWLLSKGITPGKWLVGERVIEKTNGEKPGFARMILRETAGKFVSSLCFGVGYFWAIWDKDGQAWHDKIAGTLVVKKK